MQNDLPSVFVIGSSATLLMHPHLQRMLAGICRYSRKGDEPEAVRAAMADLDTPQGASAGDSARVLAYLHALERDETFAPDIVLLHVGLHDLKTDPVTGRKQVPLDQYVANLDTILDWFAARNIRVIWVVGGPLDENLHNARSANFKRYEAAVKAYAAAADTIVRRRGLSVLDLAGFTARLGPLSELLKDHIHFHDHVVQCQAAFITGYLAAIIAKA